MSNEKLTRQMDNLLELLSKPLSRYILSVIAGVDPGVYVDPSDDIQRTSKDKENIDS